MRILDLELLALCLTPVPVPLTLFPATHFHAVVLLFPHLCWGDRSCVVKQKRPRRAAALL